MLPLRLVHSYWFAFIIAAQKKVTKIRNECVLKDRDATITTKGATK